MVGSQVRVSAAEVVRLIAAVPKARRWIDRTIAAHEDEARPVDSFGFDSLRRWFSPQLLQSARAVVVDRVPTRPVERWGFDHIDIGFGPPERTAGITFRDTFFVRRDALGDSLFFHELIHVVQWRQLGFGRFALLYGFGLLEGGYRDSPLEAMAYDLQARFLKGDSPIDAGADAARQTQELARCFRRSSVAAPLLWHAAKLLR